MYHKIDMQVSSCVTIKDYKNINVHVSVEIKNGRTAFKPKQSDIPTIIFTSMIAIFQIGTTQEAKQTLKCNGSVDPSNNLAWAEHKHCI